MNRAEVLEKLAPFHAQRNVAVANPDQARVVLDGGELVLHAGHRQGDYPVAPEGAKSLMAHIGLPTKLVEKLDADLGRRVINSVIQREPFGVTLQEDRVVALTPFAQNRASLMPERVVDAALEAAPQAWFDRVDVRASAIDLYLATREYERPVYPAGGHEHANDLVAGGAAITFSPSGTVEMMVRAYTSRLVCTNGLISTRYEATFDYGGNHRPAIWLRNTVRLALRQVDAVASDFRNLAAQAIPDEHRADTLAGLAQRARLTGPERELLYEQAVQSPPANMWEALNLITWIGSHMAGPNRAPRLMTIAGNIAQEHEQGRLCPLCHHAHFVPAPN